MTLRDQAAALLPSVRAEIRQLAEFEASLLRLLGGEPLPPPAPAVDVPAAAPRQADSACATAAPLVPVVSPAPVVVQPAPRLWAPDERRAAVLHLLKSSGPLRVAKLAAQLDIAQGHLQADLAQLAKDGHVARVEPGTYACIDVVWSGKTPLLNPEDPALARRPS